MRTKLLLLFFIFLTTVAIKGQNCKIQLANYEDRPLKFYLKIDDTIAFTSTSDGIVVIPNVNKYKDYEYKMLLQNTNLYLAYDVNIYKRRDAELNEENFTYSSVKLKDLCLNTENTYYLILKQRLLNPTKSSPKKN